LWDKTIPKMISIEFHLAGDLKTIHADPVEMEQILMNLYWQAVKTTRIRLVLWPQQQRQIVMNYREL